MGKNTVKTLGSARIGITVILALALALMSAAPAFCRADPQRRDPGPNGPNRVALTPAGTTVDRVTHDQGNIVTTVDNFGLIGGWSYYGLPSGEWPANSGHDYLAEINYWMGAVTDDGDTLVATTWDDFQAEPSLVAGDADYKILLSTDTTRYYGYDPTDTVGAGHGNPADGWRVWDPKAENWVYEENYVPSLDDTLPGGPIAVQESHYLFNDAASGQSELGLEVTHTVYQWNYCYNEDFMFVVLEITNKSDQDYHNFSFGLYVDIDVGGPEPLGDNGRLGDLPAFDSTENLGWIYDADGYDPGWGRTVTTGLMGTKYLETPSGIGMTAFRSGIWDSLPDDDPGRYAMLNSSSFDLVTTPADQYYIMCTKGIDLLADSTVRVVYALIAGADVDDFRDNAALAQQLYDNHFIGPEPPPTPTLSAQPGDEKVYLSWDAAAQNGTDPLSGENDFAGYKLYRSDNQGLTWGAVNTKSSNDCLTTDYVPLATYSVPDPTSLIQRSFIDTGLINGVDYWYSLVAFDTGASASGVSVLQNGWGTPTSSQNAVLVTPRNDPAGYFDAAGTVTHTYDGSDQPSDGQCLPAVFDRTVLTGSDYRVVFEDAPEDTYWHLINMTTGDTVAANQTLYADDPSFFPVVEGLRVVMRNPDRTPTSMAQTTLGGADTTLAITEDTWYGPGLPALTEDSVGFLFGDAPYRASYELRVTGDSTLAPEIREHWYGPIGTYVLPFEIWDVTTGTRVSAAVLDRDLSGTYSNYPDLICIVDYPYNPNGDLTTEAFPYYYSWLFGFDNTIYNPTVGDVYTLEGAHLNGPGDEFDFKADGINVAQAKVDLSKIRVVPDPYYAYAPLWDNQQGENVIQFQNIPDECTIRVYTLAGDLVAKLEHNDGSGTLEWDLLTDGRRLVSAGIYLYHVESKYGERLGRFAVIK